MAQVAAGAETPGAALRRQLVELAANPSSVQELVETGRAALAVGDGEAALGFFMRAGQLAPRDARVKAGLAAAYARTGRPETALVTFAEARSLGAPEAELAGERGLAHDLMGQTARAQQDYMLSLRHREDPEVRRRLALSLAISGQRDAALRLLEAQMARGDRAAGRARVMAMALSGDASGAMAAARTSLPPQAAQALAPFLGRLAALTPGQMAAAANLGQVPGAAGGLRPGAGRGTATADPGALAFAGGGATIPGRLPVATPPATGDRRRPGVTGTASVAPPVRGRTPVRGAPAPDRWTTASSSAAVPPVVTRPAAALPAASAATTLFLPHPHEPLPAGLKSSAVSTAEPVQLAGAVTPRIPAADPVAAAMQEPVLTGGAPAAATPGPARIRPPAPAVQPSLQPAATITTSDGAQANLRAWGSIGPAPAVPTSTPVASTAAVSTPASSTAALGGPAAVSPAATPRPGFSDVAASIGSLDLEPVAKPAATTPLAPARRAPAPVVTAARGTTASTPAKPRATPTRPAHPSRIWVQLGYSENRGAFAHDLKRMRAAAPDLFRGRSPFVASAGNRHRLLVGPFDTRTAAQAFVNGLKAKDISAVAWTSPAGTEVARLAAQ